MITTDQFEKRMGEKYGIIVGIKSLEFGGTEMFSCIVQDGWTSYVKDDCLVKAEVIYLDVINNPYNQAKWAKNRQLNENKNIEAIKKFAQNDTFRANRKLENDPNFGFGRDHE